MCVYIYDAYATSSTTSLLYSCGCCENVVGVLPVDSLLPDFWK